MLAHWLILWKSSRKVPDEEKPKIYLLEFDERFAVFPEFVFYDFHNPLKLPRENHAYVYILEVLMMGQRT